jgi:CBS domain-containing protein
MKFKVNAVMTRNVERVSPAETLEQAARKMRLQNVGILPVVDEHKVVGILTDRDIVLRAVSEGMRPYMTRVRDVMTRKVISCYEDQSITAASWLMEKNFVHRLVVFDREDNLVGLISLSDIAAKIRNEALSGHVLSKVVAA